MIERLVVVVPAHNEEALIEAAVAAVRRAALQLSEVVTSVAVVANGCTDDTARLAAAAGATVLDVQIPNVGAARAAGMTWALDQHTGDLDRLWLATTDADSEVDRHWLSAQLDAAAGGADAYLGTVRLRAVDRPTFASWSAAYVADFAAPGRHGHVHGASMGMRASTYVCSGGFRALPVGEDADLVARLMSDDVVIHWDESCPVVTSARLDARAPLGVSNDLGLSLGTRIEAV